MVYDAYFSNSFGETFLKQWVQGAFNWLDCAYTLGMNTYEQH